MWMTTFGLDKLSGCLAVALYDNQSQHEHELSFKCGDLLTILACEPKGYDGWWICSKDGKRGIAPANCLALHQPPSPSSSPSTSPNCHIQGRNSTNPADNFLLDSVYEQPDPVAALGPTGALLLQQQAHANMLKPLSPINEEHSPVSPFRQTVYENMPSNSNTHNRSLLNTLKGQSANARNTGTDTLKAPRSMLATAEATATLSRKQVTPSELQLAGTDYEMPCSMLLPEGTDYFPASVASSTTSDYGSSSQSSLVASSASTSVAPKSLSVYVASTSSSPPRSFPPGVQLCPGAGSSSGCGVSPRAVSSVMEYTTFARAAESLGERLNNLALLGGSGSLGSSSKELWSPPHHHHQSYSGGTPDLNTMTPTTLAKTESLARLKRLYENFVQLNEKMFKFVHSKWKTEESLQNSLPILRPTCNSLVIAVLDFMEFCRETLAFNSNFCVDRVLPKKLWRHLRPLEEMSEKMASAIEHLNTVDWRPKDVATLCQHGGDTDHLGRIIQCARDCAIEIRSLSTTIQTSADALYRGGVEGPTAPSGTSSPVLPRSVTSTVSNTSGTSSPVPSSSASTSSRPTSDCSASQASSTEVLEQLCSQVHQHWANLQPPLEAFRESVASRQPAGIQLAQSKLVLKHSTDLVYTARNVCSLLVSHSRGRSDLERAGNALLEALKQLICETKISYQHQQGEKPSQPQQQPPLAQKLLASIAHVREQAQSLVNVVSKL